MGRPRTHRELSALAAALALLSAGCVSDLRGPQLTQVPPGFGLDLNCQAFGVPLAERGVVRQRCYGTLGEPHSAVTITELSGPTSRAEAEEEWESLSEHAWQDADVEELHETTVDGQPAWAWWTRTPGSTRLTAIVSHADATFVVEYMGSEARYRDEADILGTVESFRRDPGRIARVVGPVVGVVLLAGLGLLAFRAYRTSRREESQRRLQEEIRARYAAKPGKSAQS